ncbi:hypothetical protein M3J09_013320 [Ascochyta lentis]
MSLHTVNVLLLRCCYASRQESQYTRPYKHCL